MPLYGASPVHAPDLPRGRTALWLVAFAAMHPKNKLSDSGVEAAAHRVMFYKPLQAQVAASTGQSVISVYLGHDSSSFEACDGCLDLVSVFPKHVLCLREDMHTFPSDTSGTKHTSWLHSGLGIQAKE